MHEENLYSSSSNNLAALAELAFRNELPATEAVAKHFPKSMTVRLTLMSSRLWRTEILSAFDASYSSDPQFSYESDASSVMLIWYTHITNFAIKHAL